MARFNIKQAREWHLRQRQRWIVEPLPSAKSDREQLVASKGKSRWTVFRYCNAAVHPLLAWLENVRRWVNPEREG